MNSALYSGKLRHRRFAPREHSFRYRLFMMYLDLDELDEVFRGRWLWSSRRPAVSWFRRADYLGGSTDQPLKQAVLDLVGSKTGRALDGPVRMLTHLRTFGYCFNPVTFYYCHERDDDSVQAIVAEITNTPWRERHSYVLDLRGKDATARTAHSRFAKQFHVSPFFGMEQEYDWRFQLPGQQLGVHMENWQSGSKVFDSTLTLERQPITARSLALALLRFPALTATVTLAIYWQAFRLWWKRCPFHPHPSISGKSMQA